MNFRNFLFVAAVFIYGTSAAQQITRVPYLQKPAKTSVTIKWRTDIPSESRLGYRPANSQNSWKEAFTPGLRTEHEVSLNDLTPGTWYSYAVLNAQQVLLSTPEMKFRTSPEGKDQDPIVIWAMGDFGDNTQQKYIENQNKVKNAFWSKTSGTVDLWLWLGDNSYCCGTDAQYQTGAFDFYEPGLFGSIPVMPVPGNHEYYATQTAQTDHQIPYFDIFSLPANGESGGLASGTEDYYSFDYGNVHFIALDSYGLEDGKRLSHPQSRQYQWLERDLQQTQSEWIVVFFHHPPYSLLGHVSDALQELRDIRLNLVPLFDAYGVDLVLNGHSHNYERTKLIKNHRYGSETWRDEFHLAQPGSGNYNAGDRPYINKTEGTVYVVVGSAGRLDWNGINGQLPAVYYQNKDIGGSMKITVRENRMDAEWIAGDGQVKDSFSFFKNVNSKKTITAEWGEPVDLKASWIGDYQWSGGAKDRIVSVLPKSDTLVTVSDDKGHLRDEFQIKVTARPELRTTTRVTEACVGQALEIGAELSHASLAGKQMTLQVLEGSRQIAEVQVASFPFSYRIPVTNAGELTFQVRALGKDYLLYPGTVSISKPANVRIANAGSINYADEIRLKLEVTSGTLPVKIDIDDSLHVELTQPVSEFVFSARQSKTFTITKAVNLCGQGTFDTGSLHVLSPLSAEPAREIQVFPNPARGFVDVIFAEDTILHKVELWSTDGKKIIGKETKNSQLRLDLRPYPAGVYLLKAAGKEFRLVVE